MNRRSNRTRLDQPGPDKEIKPKRIVPIREVPPKPFVPPQKPREIPVPERRREPVKAPTPEREKEPV